MHLQNVRFLNGGYCVQCKYLSGVNSWRWRRFYAVFISFEHPQHGQCLIDTGYGPEVIQQTRRWPWRILKWFTPIPANQDFTKPNYLHNQKLDPAQVQTIFVSHFHADHIGGLSLFPDSRFAYREESLESLHTLSSQKKLENGFLPGLLPAGFSQRGLPILEVNFETGRNELNEFKTLDYWGDESLILIDLPGHAIGHTGFLLNTNDGPIFYVVDAFWDYRAFSTQKKIPMLSRRILDSWPECQRTNQKLAAWAKLTGRNPLACHCPVTQEYVQRTAN